MKAAVLVVFSVSSFLILFAFAVFVTFLHLWVTFAISVPAETSASIESFAPAFLWAIPFALHLGILLSVNYAFRQKINPVITFIIVFAFFYALTYAANIFTGKLTQIKAEPIALRGAGRTLGREGLMLSNSETTIVLLGKTSEAYGSRVVSIPDEKLIYQEEPLDADGGVIGLPPVPFRIEQNAIFDGIRLDFALSARHLRECFEEGLFPFSLWVGAVTLLQITLSLIFNIGIWPLANLFLGALILRLFLSFEVFVNSVFVQEKARSLLDGYLPDWYISPLIFSGLTALLLVYIIIHSAAKGKSHA
ncbi:MAG: hypothetical protein LBG72_01625 [Spirochaetaceae bacterium]|jgi:hypothetical protein|nr:hypothetical protein [Spirochaetaceae bacterium]